MMILMTNFIIVVLITTLLVQGLGLVIAVATILIVLSISSLTMPSGYALSGVIVATVAGIGLLLLDMSYSGNRLTVPQIEIYSPYIAALLGLGFIFIGLREFHRFSLRVKIAVGTLIAGVITVSVLVVFGLNRSSLITNNLLNQYKSSTIENIQRQTLSNANNTADQANNLFALLVNDINVMTSYRANLEAQKEALGQGTYWNASTQLHQLPGGQYGNSASDPRSVVVPSTVNVDEALLADLNTTAYFDFYALNYLKNRPEVMSFYFISKDGSTTYYPNIDLAKKLPPNFDPRTQPYYTISEPANDTSRKPNWVSSYQDPAGQGMIVTLSAPVYLNKDFIGVIGINIQPQQFLGEIANIKIGQTGYVFLVDEVGRILAMPNQGYSLFGMQPDEPATNGTPEQIIIGKGSDDLQYVVREMMSGRTGLETISLNNENLYFGFAPLYTPNFRIGFIVPEKEFTADMITAQNIAQTEIRNTLQQMTIILIVLFIASIIISLLVGQIITRPLLRLTKTVETISEGNLAVRANVDTEDEIGVLARAFNSMTGRLSETLANLEGRVTERTEELEIANQKNTYRANQFEAITRVAQTIRSTQTLDSLLPLITVTISEQFDFYHVGIFLLDIRREYAVLVAANSEGGRKMLERNHSLLVGGTGIVGFVTHTGQPRVALNVGLDSVYFNNPDLPDTRSEIALPLRIGSEIFGALDVQSKRTNAFTQDDINILSTLADQVSIAIQNARSYQQTREALAQAEASSIQLSGQQWKQFLTRQDVKGFSFDGVATTQVSQSDTQRPHSLAIPLTLRGAKIGSIKLNASDPDRIWTDDEISMVQAAAERTSLALESARLLEEAQKRATKERVIGEISAKIGSSSDLESILQTAIQELGNTLPGTDIAIQFKNSQETE
jgi:GAF domain-containing protein/HAMP domain-containing protein